MRAAILLIAALLCGCASSAVVPRPLQQVENRVRILWEPRQGLAHELLAQTLPGIQPPAPARTDSQTWEPGPDIRFQTASQTEQSRSWYLEKWNLNNSFPMPEGHANIEAKALDACQTRVRVKCWDNGLLFDSRNRTRERAMLKRLVDAEPKSGSSG